MADLAPDLPDIASQPAAVTTDGLNATARPIGDVIAADRYAKANAAAKNGTGKFGLRFSKLIGPAQCPVQPGLEDTSADGSFS